MQTPIPLTRDLVLIGGGHAHALVLKAMGMRPLAGARLTVIDPEPVTAYTGMLPGFVAGHYTRGDLDIDLIRLARFAGARFVHGCVVAMDVDARTVEVEGRGSIAFDIASLNVGVTATMPDLSGFADHGVAVRPLGRFASVWAEFRSAVEAGRSPPRIAVIGAGVGGVELSLAMAHALAPHNPQIVVVDNAGPLSALHPRTRKGLEKAMDRAGIEVLVGEPSRVSEDALHLVDGRVIPAALTIGAAGARPHDWLKGSGLRLNDGFIEVNEFFRTSADGVFAAGDCVHFAQAPRPKAGVFAVRAAPVLRENLRAALTGGDLVPFRPQRDYLKLISLGGQSALADRSGMRLAAPWLWRLKDRIDRRFMERLRDLPTMPAPRLPGERAAGVDAVLGDGQPFCGGCGAKVGGAALAEGLAKLGKGAPEDAAVLEMGDVRQVITTDHLRAFTLDPWLLAQAAAVHALGDVWAMGARPQAAVAQITLTPMSARLQARTVAEVTGAAAGVFAQAGAAIVGGHTTQGAEMSVGFTVTGLLDGPAVTLAGARHGDRLILTGPIGTGVILAAEMALRAPGRAVAGAWAALARTQGAAAEVLRAAHAMTDVTGFGLAGHLLNMTRASGVGARVHLADIPFLDGAEDLAGDGVASTLAPVNRADAAPFVAGLASGPRADLLFDPQTCGPLLAAVDPTQAKALVAALWSAGYPAADIGEIIEGPGLEVA